MYKYIRVVSKKEDYADRVTYKESCTDKESGYLL